MADGCVVRAGCHDAAAACRRHRQRLRRPRRGGAARRARLPGHGAGAARRAGRPRRVHRQDGFTFDAGPTIVTAPFLFEELWALCGRRLARRRRAARRSTRSTGSASTTARPSTTPAIPTAMRAEVAPLRARRRRRATSASWRERGDLPRRLRAARPCRRSARGPTWRGSCRDLLRLEGWRSVHGLVAPHVRDERLRVVLSFHPLLIGGNPFATTSIYCLIALPRAALGRALRDGRHRRAGAGLVGLIEGQGGDGALRRRGRARSRSSGAPRDRRAAGGGETLAADIVVSQRRFRLDLPPPAAAPEHGAAGPTGGSSARATR